MTKKSRQKFEYVENKRDLKVKIKTILINFEMLSLKQIKRLQQQCFPMNFEKIFKNSYFVENLQAAAHFLNANK